MGNRDGVGTLTMDHGKKVRCRGCPSCLRAKKYQWAIRAEYEMMMSPRTWFFTGTFASQTHSYDEASKEATDFLKRLRRRLDRKDKAKIRYLICPERHKSGAWHWHGLMHDLDTRCTFSDLRRSWTAGFSYPKLVKNTHIRAARYVTKYATKSIMEEDGETKRPRIRASRSPKYGGVMVIEDLELVQEIMKSRREERVNETWTKNLREALMENREIPPENPETFLKKLLMESTSS